MCCQLIGNAGKSRVGLVLSRLKLPIFVKLATVFLLLFCFVSVPRVEAKNFSVMADMTATRYGHTITLLPNGLVLIAGGYNNTDCLKTAEIYNPDTGTITPARDMKSARMEHTATLLANGKVLITGGRNGTVAVSSFEIYNPSNGTFSSIATNSLGRVGHSATLLPNGKVLVAGGSNNNKYVTAVELYDPEKDSVASVSSVVTPRSGHTATLLPNGKVILVGGMNGNTYITSAEVYDPVANKFSTVGQLNANRIAHTATLLEDGRLLISGGRNESGIVSKAEIFDPATGVFTLVDNMVSARADHTSTLMPDGGVLIAGGRNALGYLNTGEVFYPETGAFSATSNMSSVRDISSAILLPSGKVLVAGGWDGVSAACSAEIFDPEIIQAKYRLHLNTVGKGEGSVKFTPGRNCSGGCAQFYPSGTNVRLTPILDPDSVFLGWSGCDSVDGSDCIVTMSKNRHVKLKTTEAEADDNKAEYGVSATSGPNGSLTPNGTTMVVRGKNITYTITPANGYHVAEVLVDGHNDLGVVDSFTFANVKKPHTISATFALNNAFTITASAGVNGAISPQGPQVLAIGTVQTYVITPAAGFKIADVLVDNVSVGAISSYTFTDIAADHTISATFIANLYTITATAGANGSIDPAGVSTVIQGNGQNFTITPATGYKVEYVLVDGASVGAVTNFSFSNVTANHTISASFIPVVFVITASADTNGTISPTGPTNVNSGADQGYTITAATNFKVADVLVDGVSKGAVTSYSFSNVTANHSISATFAPVVYVITASAGANGSINPAGPANVKSGADQVYTITAAPNFKVTDVLVDGVSIGAVTSYSFTNVKANHTISVTFAPTVFVITASSGANGSITPAGASNVNSGAGQTYSITAAPNFKVVDVLVDGVSIGAVASYNFTSVTTNHTISASFAPIVYVITASTVANGSITPAGPVNVNGGAGQTYSITAATNFKVTDVLVDGVSVGTMTSYSFTAVTANHTISAAFTPIIYVITATAGANGNISLNGPANVNSGDGQAYAISAAPNFKVADVLVDGVSVGAVTSYIFTNVTAAHTISASFAPIVYVITASTGTNGSISPSGPFNVNSGSDQAYTITPVPNFKVSDVQVDGGSVGAVTSYSFSNVTANHTISASFAPIVYVITASAGANGSITSAGPSNVNSGSEQAYTITATPNFKVADVLVDGITVGAVTSYNFTSVTTNHTISASFAPIVYVITASAGANGSITPAGPVNVNGGAGQNYAIAAAPNFKVADVLVDGVSIGAVASYNFTSVTTNHTISASFAPIVYVITASTGANGSITPSGSSNVNSGAEQTYSITAAPNFKVSDVLVDGVSVGTMTSYSFTAVTANHTISASFAPIVYVITASTGANGSITPAGPGNVNSGAGQTYSITAAPNFKVADVLVDGASVGAVTSYSFINVTASHTISANFAPIVYVVTASAGVNGSINPVGANNVNSGAGIVFAIVPVHGGTPLDSYKVADVLVDGSSVGALTSYTFSNVTANHSITASFTPLAVSLDYFIVTATAGTGGSITSAGDSVLFPGENSPVYGITPTAGYQIAQVLIDGVSMGKITTYSFSGVTSNRTITATFTPITYAVTATSGANGSIDPVGATTVNYAAAQNYSIAPALGFKVADVLVDGVSVGAVTNYSFTNVTSNHTISASFTSIVLTVAATANTNGSISPVGLSNVNYGSGLTYGITPAAGFKVSDVLVDGVSVGAVTSYTFTNVTATHTISATFTPIVYVITASAGANGSITPAGQVNVSFGAGQSFTVTPAVGFKVADVQVDGATVGKVTSYTFTNVTAVHTIAVTFTPVTYDLIATSGANGSIDPTGLVTVNHGVNQTYTITPATGFKVADVQVDGASVGKVTSYTFTNVTAGHSLVAAFTPITFDLTASTGANGSIDPVGVTTVNSGDSKTYTISPATLCRILDVQVDGVSVGAVTSYSFTNVTAIHTISATFQQLVAGVDYFGITAVAPTIGGAITPEGVRNVLKGADSTVYTVTPSYGYVIVSVGDNGVQIAKRPVGTFTYTFVNVQKAHTISSTFQLATYTISPSVVGNGSMSPANPVTPTFGASQYCSFTPSAGYHVADVLIDGVSIGAVANYTFTNINASHTIQVQFEANAPVTVTATAGANGSISPAGVSTVLSGSNLTYTMTPQVGYRVAGVVVDGVSKGAINSYTFAKISSTNHTIDVTFTLDIYTITSSAGANGAISPAGVVTDIAPGSTLVYTITPAAGYKVSNVIVDGSSKGNVTSYIFAGIVANHTISVTFTPITYAITQSAGLGGTNYPNSVAYIVSGTNATYSIAPDPGYHVADVLVDGVSVGAVTTYTFTNVTADHSIASIFAENPTVTITATAGANGSISPSGAVSVVSGKNITFTMTADAAYRVADIIVDGVSKGALNSYTFTNVSAVNHTINVTFMLDIYIISTNAGPGGSISPSANVVVAKGGNSPLYTVTPSTGYVIVSVGDNGKQLAKDPVAPYTYSFGNVTTDHVLSATFRLSTYAITPIIGANGSMTPAIQLYPTYGANQYCTITPNSGYHVEDVLIDGVSIGPVTSYTFSNISAPHTIESRFAANPSVTVTASTGAHGTIDPVGVTTVLSGSSLTYNMSPTAGYRVADVIVDGVSMGAVNSYTFTKITELNHTISVTFTQDIYTIIATAEANGIIDPAGTITINGGDSITFTITPAEGYKVLNLAIDGVYVGAQTTYTFSTVSGNHTINPSFALIQ